MKRFVMALALTCALSASAFAGDVPIVPAPAPPGDVPISGSPAPPGEIPSGGSTAPGDMPGVAVSALLAILDLAF